MSLLTCKFPKRACKIATCTCGVPSNRDLGDLGDLEQAPASSNGHSLCSGECQTGLQALGLPTMAFQRFADQVNQRRAQIAPYQCIEHAGLEQRLLAYDLLDDCFVVKRLRPKNSASSLKRDKVARGCACSLHACVHASAHTQPHTLHDLWAEVHGSWRCRLPLRCAAHWSSLLGCMHRAFLWLKLGH